MTEQQLTAYVKLLNNRIDQCREEIERYEGTTLEDFLKRAQIELKAYQTVLKDIEFVKETYTDA